MGVNECVAVNRLSVSYAVVGDLHLAHSRTPTRHIINNLKEWLTPMFSRIAVLFFTGDVFDKLITYPSQASIDITLFVYWLLDNCKQNNIVLRVLEGTRSHDWNQSHMFETLANGGDVKWVNTVSIEHIPVLGMDVLYVPDEANRWCKDTLDEVHQLLIEKKLKMCDLAMMHGVFKYQLSLLPDTHDQAAYEDIIKHTIYIGHIHTSILSGKIHPPGSFERLAHNEEESKGAILATYCDNAVTNEVIPNVNAYPYVSIDVSGMPINKAIALIKSKISTLRYGRIRVVAEHDNPILDSITSLKSQYHHLKIETHRIKIKHDDVDEIVCEYKATTISKSNIVETMETFLKKVGSYDKTVIAKLKEYV